MCGKHCGCGGHGAENADKQVEEAKKTGCCGNCKTSANKEEHGKKCCGNC